MTSSAGARGGLLADAWNAQAHKRKGGGGQAMHASHMAESEWAVGMVLIPAGDRRFSCQSRHGPWTTRAASSLVTRATPPVIHYAAAPPYVIPRPSPRPGTATHARHA